MVQHYLSDSPFILLSSGSFVLAESIVMEMDSDLSSQLHAPPDYLSSFAGLLSIVGAPKLRTYKASVNISITAVQTNSNSVIHKLHTLLNNEHLSDVVFDLGEGKKVYAHKVILGLASGILCSVFEFDTQTYFRPCLLADFVSPILLL